MSGYLIECLDRVDSTVNELTEVMNNIETDFLKQLEKVQKKVVKEVKHCRKTLNDSRQNIYEQIESTNSKVTQYIFDRSANKVKVNIGGTVFATTEGTLTSKPGYFFDASCPEKSENTDLDTFFTALLGNGNWLPDEDGEYYIDRSAIVFEYVLKYLRDSYLVLPEIPVTHHSQLFRDLDFYQIGTKNVFNCKLEWCKSHLAMYCDVFELNEHTSTITKIKDGTPKQIGLLCNSLHEVTKNDQVKWRMILHRNPAENTSNNATANYWQVGVCNKEQDWNTSLTICNLFLFDQTQTDDSMSIPFTHSTGTVEFSYLRSKETVTINTGSKTVTRKLHPSVAANPCPCVYLNNGCKAGGVTVELIV